MFDFSMLDLIIRLGLRFTDEEREKCLGVAKRMIGLALVAHEQGILGLADRVVKDETSNDFTIMAAEILSIGYDTATLKKALEYSLVTNSHSGEQLLERLIIAESFITISGTLEAMGETLGDVDGSFLTRVVAVTVGAMLGESYVLPLIRYADSLVTTAVDVDAIIDEYAAPVPGSDVLENRLCRLSKVNLYYVLTTLDMFQVTTALKGFSKTFLHYLHDNLPETTGTQLFNFLGFMPPMDEAAISEAQDMLLAHVEELQLQ